MMNHSSSSSSSLGHDDDDDKANSLPLVANSKAATKKKKANWSHWFPLPVCEPEQETGPVEYKRQLNPLSETRLRSLATQLSFRLDQAEDGAGATYCLGVEDNGCHSLLDYSTMAHSCQVLEYLARHYLNAVVVQRTMIQDEIVSVRVVDTKTRDKEDQPTSTTTRQQPTQPRIRHAKSGEELIYNTETTNETSTSGTELMEENKFGSNDDSFVEETQEVFEDDEEGNDENNQSMEKMTISYEFCSKGQPFVFDEPSIWGSKDNNDLAVLSTYHSPTILEERRQPGKYITRALVRIQRIETHALPPIGITLVFPTTTTTTTNNNGHAMCYFVQDQPLQEEPQPDQRNGKRNETTANHTLDTCGVYSNGMDQSTDHSHQEKLEHGEALPNSHMEQRTMETTTKTRMRPTPNSTQSPTLDDNTSIQKDLSSSKQTLLARTPSSEANKTQTTHSIGETLSFRNVRIAVMGNVDAGKSTLIGTLTTSCLDDGRGKTRTFVMRHRHEIETGRTSTATTHLMGFHSNGKPIVGRDSVRSNKIKGPDEIAKESHCVVTLMDLAGHEKFLKTTIHGVSSGFADYALVLVNSRQPPTHMTRHHLNLCSSFSIPIIMVFTKMDGCPKHALQACEQEITQMLRSPDVAKRPLVIKTAQDVARVVDKVAAGGTAPMIHISCVTGEGIELLQKLFFSLPKRRRHASKTRRKFEFLVDEVFDVPNVGCVVSGFVNAGELNVVSGGRAGGRSGAPSASIMARSRPRGGHASSSSSSSNGTHVHIGPMQDGSFLETRALSAHLARINTTHITAGQSATLALDLDPSQWWQLRRGMVVLKDPPGPLSATRQFDAEICVLSTLNSHNNKNTNQNARNRGGEEDNKKILSSAKPTKLRETYVHVLNVRQMAVVRNIELVDHRPTSSIKNTINGNSEPMTLRPDDDDITGDDADTKEEDNPVLWLEPGSRAKVRFEFLQRPEYVRPGMRLMFRDGHVRGVGLVTSLPSASTGAEGAGS